MLNAYLNELTATFFVMYGKFRQYHYQVEGPQFFTLHEKFEELYTQTEDFMDLVAERLLQFHEVPVSTLTEAVEKSWIKESKYTKSISAVDMVKNTVSDYKTLQDKLVEGIRLTDEDGDDVTNDILIGFKTEIDKNVWMLEAFLG